MKQGRVWTAAAAQLGVALVVSGCGGSPTQGSPTPGEPSPTEAPVVDPTATAAPTAAESTIAPTASASPSPSPAATRLPTPSIPPPTPTAAVPTPAPTPTPAVPTPSLAAPTESPTPTADDACDPPLALGPEDAFVQRDHLLTFSPGGGTGAYRFEITQNRSGAIINAVTGAYLAGGGDGVTDVVRLTDRGCAGEALAEVSVVRDLSLRPLSAEVAPGAALTFQIEEGSGSFACHLERADSRAEVSEGCAYVAGDGEGLDVVRVDDLLTGQHEEAQIVVRAGARVEAVPPRVIMPVGATFTLPVDGGSGDLDIQRAGEAARVIDGDLGWLTLQADAPGETVFDLTDRFTGEVARLSVQAVVSQGGTSLRAGDLTMSGEALAPGDLDGDGIPDAILTLPEGDLGAYNGGAVYVYAGTGDGLDPEPVQIFSGTEWESELGRGIWVGDIDGDGEKDLLTGAYREDRGFTDVGVVRMHRGVPGGFFEDEPAFEMVGLESSGWFGYSVAACDLDQDGYPDIAVGALRIEDDALQDTPADAGGVMIYRGGPYGYALKPDLTLQGRIWDGAKWTSFTNLYMGTSLKAEDVDGDGRCDLVVGAWQYDPDRGSNTGAVALYFGREPAEGDPLGVGPNPDVFIEPAPGGGDTSHFGRRLALGDLDGDGAKELLVSQWRYSDPAVGTYNGALRIYSGDGLADAGPHLTDLDADATLEGDNGSDYAGWVADVAYVGPEQTPLIVVGDLQGEVSGGPSNRGRVAIFGVGEGGLDQIVPLTEYSDDTLASSDFFGQAVSVLGDVDGDQVPDLLVLAGRASAYGYRVGVPYLLSTPLKRLTPLQMPGDAAGSQLSRGTFGLVDLNGDGRLDLAAGAPYADPAGTSNAGEVYLYAGDAQGVATSPTAVLAGFTDHGNSDYLGWSVAPAGDFDGDGSPDLVALAGADDAPSSFNSSYANRTDCAGSRSNPGSIFVFPGRVDGAFPSGDPTFVYYGPVDTAQMQKVDGGFDFNGDGRDDVVMAQPGWDIAINNGGGAAFVSGRAPGTPGKITVICEADLVVSGVWDGEQLGTYVAGLGDLNQDGCDEVGLGAPFTDVSGLSNQGQVTIVFGWGGPGCPAEPEILQLNAGISNANAGYGFAGKVDFTGDGVPDVAIGAPNLDSDGDRPGGVFLLSGAAIAAAPRAKYVPGQAPPMVTFASVGVLDVLLGHAHAADFGEALTLVDGLPGGGVGLLVGAPEGGVAGVPITGGAWLYRLTHEGGVVDAQLIAAMGGETDEPLTLVGEMVAAGRTDEGMILAVGGYRADGQGVDQGAIFVGLLPDP